MIEVENLTKVYADIPAVDGVSFTVPEGQICALVGTSGCGKSTTLRMINRLVEPTAGRVRINGVDTRSVKAETLRLGIGYAIQGAGLFPHRTVAENIATVPELLGWDRARIAARVEAVMAMLKLDPALSERYPASLSGGQQQRVGVARALAGEPSVLLMDEPFGALDPVTRDELQEEFHALQRRAGITVLFVTHDMDEAFRLADQIAVMDRGRLLQCAAPAELLTDPADPYVQALVGTRDLALRYLSLKSVSSVMRPANGRWGIQSGSAVEDRATGQTLAPLAPEDTLREAASRLLWQGADVLPVLDGGGALAGEVTLDAVREAGRHGDAA